MYPGHVQRAQKDENPFVDKLERRSLQEMAGAQFHKGTLIS